MAVKSPNLDQLRRVAESLGMTMSDAELASYHALMQGNVAAYEAIDLMADYVPAVTYPRTPGYRPEGEENRYNAWYVKSEIKGAATGKLAGKRVAVKDNVCVAGVPMMNGASILEGYTPDVDATDSTTTNDNNSENNDYSVFHNGFTLPPLINNSKIENVLEFFS